MDALLVSADHLAQLEEHLLLMRRLLSESVPPADRRGWLLEQCRRRGDDERELWRALARYRQTGAAGLLSADRPRRTIFGRRDALARERVLTRADRHAELRARRVRARGAAAGGARRPASRFCAVGCWRSSSTPSRGWNSKPIICRWPSRCCCTSSPRRSNGCARSASRGRACRCLRCCATTATICAGVAWSASARTSNERRRHRLGTAPGVGRGGVR